PPALLRAATLTVNLDRSACLWTEASSSAPRPSLDAPPAASAQRLHGEEREGRSGPRLPPRPRSLGGMTITATIQRSRLGGEGRMAQLSLRRAGPARGHEP
ncbi:MAG: hypothetical protein ACOCVR_03455, partial [Myxococcota bacterium]